MKKEEKTKQKGKVEEQYNSEHALYRRHTLRYIFISLDLYLFDGKNTWPHVKYFFHLMIYCIHGRKKSMEKNPKEILIELGTL